MSTEQNPQERLEYQGDMQPVFNRAAAAYGFGELIDFHVVPVGYEDYNAMLHTEQGMYFAKVFSAERTPEDIQRYADIMTAVMQAGVNHPRMYETVDGLVYRDTEVSASIVAMDYVEGETFYDVGRVPSDAELREVLHQAVLINNIPFQPPFIYDSWAITNLAQTYRPIKDKLSPEDQQIIEQVITELDSVDQQALPHCFVHGDLVKSNILVGADGKMYVLDFSVSNWYPRIQELAVIVGNLINTPAENRTFLDILKHVVAEYVGQGGELTKAEVTALPAFARAAYVAEFVGAQKEKHLNGNNSAENEYWLTLGRAGLMRSLN